MPRDVIAPEYAGTGTRRAPALGVAGTMRRVDIPGIGVVEFPESMSDADVTAAAQRLHRSTNAQTASPEQFTPAPRTERLPADPSFTGFGANLARGAMDAVSSIPRVIKGISRINPAELPGQIVSGIKERVQSYSDDPLSTIYDDPLSFLGDAAAVTGAGAAMRAPLQAGGRAASAAASKVTAPIVRQIRRSNITPTDLVKGGLSSLVSKEMPFVGAVRSGVERASESRMAREALGSGRLNTGRVDRLEDVLQQALEEARSPVEPSRVGGVGAPLRAGKNLPVVNPERAGGMISTQPDKFGATSIHPAGDFVDRSRLVDRARSGVAAEPPVAPKLPGEFTPDMSAARPMSTADDAVSRYIGGNPQRQDLLRELLRGDESVEGLTRAGRSMMTPAELERFKRAMGQQTPPALEYPEAWKPFIRR